MHKISTIKLIYFVVFFSLSICNVYAANSYTTVGARSCQDWNENSEKYNTKSKDDLFSWVPFLSDRSWLMGFASGVNSMAAQDLLDHLDSDILIDWTTKHCKENPSASVSDVVFKLFGKTQELINKK